MRVSRHLSATALGGRADRERGRRSGTRAEPGKAEEGGAVELRRPTTTRPGEGLPLPSGGTSRRRQGEGGAVELRRPTTTRPGEGLPLPSGGTSRRRQGEGGAPWHATPRALSA